MAETKLKPQSLIADILADWFSADETWTFYSRTQAYTNDPAAGSNITLNMTNTLGFTNGSNVTVSSSAGSESATVINVVSNTSITVDFLALNHTTSSPLVTLNNAFTVPGNVTTKYQLGDKLKYAQSSTTKYGYALRPIYDSSNTRTIMQAAAGSSYSLVNATITDPFYSRSSDPYGFPPDGFSYTPRWTSDGTAPAIGNGVVAGKFKLDGMYTKLIGRVVFGSTSTYGTGNYSFSTPFGSSDTGFDVRQNLLATGTDSGTALYPGTADIPGGSTTLIVRRMTTGAQFAQTSPFTWGNGDSIVWNGEYLTNL